MNILKKRLEALEQAAALRAGDHDEADLLSPRDVAFLLIERQTLEELTTPDSAALTAKIDALLRRHELTARAGEPMTPVQASVALIAAAERTEEDDAQYRREWLERLEAMA